MASELENAIVDLLDRRPRGRTICPSEAARAVGGEDWRELMGEARSAAAALADRGVVVVTQRGRIVSARTSRGPIRIGFPKP